MNRTPSAMTVLALIVLTGCRKPGVNAWTPTNGPESRYMVRGHLVEKPADKAQAVVRHEAIPGYMPSMTMTFNVRNPGEIANLKAGDEIEFKLVVNEDESWIESVRRIGHGSTSPPSAPRPAVRARELATGDEMPDTAFTDESGGAVTLRDFRGRALAFTFIFTRCPLPDFCPRLSRHFNQARDRLIRAADSPTNWQFLSLSFDPDHDTPEALSRYARSYRGTNTDRWLFGALSRATLAQIAPRLDLKVHDEGGSLSHNLRTVVLDTHGRVFRQLDGNDWTPEDLAKAVTEAAEAPGKP